MNIGVIRRDGRTDAFFAAAARDRLALRRCGPCDRWYAPEASSCPECGSEHLDWADASGRATLVSWVIAHERRPEARAAEAGRPEDPAEPGGDPADGSPAGVLLGLVELAEGPWLHTRLEGVERSALRVGMSLVAEFVHPDEGESFPVFRPATDRAHPGEWPGVSGTG
jgi:uncharacterized OB-fold protein